MGLNVGAFVGYSMLGAFGAAVTQWAFQCQQVINVAVHLRGWRPTLKDLMAAGFIGTSLYKCLTFLETLACKRLVSPKKVAKLKITTIPCRLDDTNPDLPECLVPDTSLAVTNVVSLGGSTDAKIADMNKPETCGRITLENVLPPFNLPKQSSANSANFVHRTWPRAIGVQRPRRHVCSPPSAVLDVTSGSTKVDDTLQQADKLVKDASERSPPLASLREIPSEMESLKRDLVEEEKARSLHRRLQGLMGNEDNQGPWWPGDRDSTRWPFKTLRKNSTALAIIRGRIRELSEQLERLR